MSLTAADVAEILRLVEGSSYKRSADGLGSRDLPADAALSSAAASPPASIAAPMAPPAAVAAADPNVHEVRSPMLGTFYHAPKPGEPPYVAVGDVVEKDTIVGIIEVMKLMNTVRAEVGGAVAEILVGDGAFVEYGEVLLRIVKPA
jgi:acetyl-CoA carboxylase biotin carboxyl carrier protein